MTSQPGAAAQNILVRGTLGLVVLAKVEDRISVVSPVLEALQQVGLYLSKQIIVAALKAAGEQ